MELKRSFNIGTTESIKHSLGIDIRRSPNGSIAISQACKIAALARQMDLEYCRFAYVPLSDDSSIDDHSSALLDEQHHKSYRSALGQILHISTWTRPDILYAAHCLACKLSKQTQKDFRALQGLVRYLVSTKDLALTFAHEPRPDLVVYSNSNWGTSQNSDLSPEMYGY